MEDIELFNSIKLVNPHIVPLSREGNIITAKCSLCGGIIKKDKYVLTKKYGCTYCNHKALLPGFNDLQTLFPNLAEYFDIERNGCKPTEVIGGGRKNYYWICNKGHIFISSIDNLKNRNEYCHYCSGRTVLSGYNDILTTHYEIAKEWNYEKNGSSPDQFTYGSENKVWWKCSWCGAEFEQKINKRTIRGYGCPNCSKKSTSFQEQTILYYVQKYFSNAKNRFLYDDKVELDIYIPNIKTAIEYDGIRWHNGNENLQKDCDKDAFCRDKGIRLIRFRDPKLPITKEAETIMCLDGNNNSLSIALVKLLSKLGISIKNDDINITRDSGKILGNYRNNVRENSFAKTFPNFVCLFHPIKNGRLTPEQISWSAGYQVWWKCNICGHEWYATPNHIARSIKNGGNGCEKCSEKVVAKKNQTRVKNLDTGVIYNSIKEACNATGCKPPDITSCCTGKQKTAKGYHWSYADVNGPRRRDNKQKIRCIETGEIFDCGKKAAVFCNGDSRNIVACCRGKNKTAYGYHWEFATSI